MVIQSPESGKSGKSGIFPIASLQPVLTLIKIRIGENNKVNIAPKALRFGAGLVFSPI
jgi:hypothetical protein